LGLIVGGHTQQKYFNHGGANFGYRCLLVAYQDNGDGAVIMTSGDNGDPLIHEILRTIAHDYAWPDYAPPVRTIAGVDPKLFDQYVAAYRFPSGTTITFWRDGTHINTRVWGQRVFEMFPTSGREYFLKDVDARWSFSGGDGADFTATLYQNGHEQVAKKLPELDNQAALDFSIETERRFKVQTAAPQSAAALRHLIAGLTNGNPNYDEMTASYAEVNREQLPMLQSSLQRLGAVESMTFKSVGAAGQDVYDVKFERGSREFRILLESDGRIHAAEFSP
jgi:hypothetical protein